MPVITWDPLYQTTAATGTTASNPLPDVKTAHRVAEILMLTAAVHRDRDFGRAANPRGLFKKVNNRKSTKYKLPNGTIKTTSPFNWMKVSIGNIDDEGYKLGVVIVYHLLRHRLRENDNSATPDPNYGFWSVSVGIHPRLIPAKILKVPVNASDTADPTVILAQEIATRISADLKSINTTATGDPSGEFAVIYDEIDAADGAGAIGSNTAGRKKTRIGRMGLIFSAGTNAIINSKIAIVSTALRNYPLSDSLDPIPGYADDHLALPDIVCTTFHAL